MGALTLVGILLALNAAAAGVIWIAYKWSVSRILLEHLGAGWQSLTEAQKGSAFIALLAVGCVVVVWIENTKYTDTIPVYDRERKVWKFGDFTCNDDCSGHVAGYGWAKNHRISDESDCNGNSQSFIEGCRVYAKEQDDPREEPVNDGE